MELMANALSALGALAAAAYCIVLARRLQRFNDLKSGVGGAIAALSTQVEDMTKALAQTQDVSAESTNRLAELTSRAERVARQLELLVASMHDLPVSEHEPAPENVREMQDETEPRFSTIRRSIREAAQ